QCLGIIGLGEIGSELARRVQPWNVKILYNDIQRKEAMEKELGLEYRKDLKSIFKEADIVSLHIPLNEKTRGIIDKTLLAEMKPYSLLVNTARGGVINTNDLLELLESGDAKINCAFDVYETEPLDPKILKRFKEIQTRDPNLRFTFTPHNASADANTRVKMAIMLLEDLAWLAGSRNLDDIKPCRIIPPQKHEIFIENKIESYRIFKYWQEF
ncbi:MAG: 2-hydroxyacid dehydrogenase, partial [Promethearchaeota archaeon]